MAQVPNFRLRRISAGIALCTGAASMVLVPSAPALANPTGASVVHGSATFAQDGNLLQIDNSPGAIIDWASFSIARDEITRFQQLSAASAVLNRVTSGEISELYGQLVSNGQVFLINPNGMVFGQNATIDTAGFVASTLDISNQDFLDGDYRFAGDSGRIINEGWLTTRSGNVFFIAPDIDNAGIIHAESGALVLAAGRSIRIGSLDTPDIQFEITAPDDEIINLGQLLADQGSIRAFAGTLTHSGAISASGVALAEDGSVILHADGDIDLQAGSTISASGANGGDVLVQSATGTVSGAGEILATGEDGDGGRVRLLGDRVGLFGAALVSAEGSANGGEILIGGNLTGLGPEPNAAAVFIGTDTRVSASSTDSGDGGIVIAYADDLNRSYGTLTARGGPNGGDGGFIETSADFIEVTRTPDAGASSGTPGEWLIDPDLLVIGAGGLDQVTESPIGVFSADPDLLVDATIQDTLIEAAIDGGTSVTVQTNGNADSIRITEPLDFNATTPGLALAFDAGFNPLGNILVEAPITNNGPEALDYLFSTQGFVDFGADVDTGGVIGQIAIDDNSGYGGAASFSADVILRGDLFAGATTVDGPFTVLLDGAFADLGSLAVVNGASLSIAGDLTLSSFFGSNLLEVSGSALDVGGFVNLFDADIAGSTVSFGSDASIGFTTFITDSDVFFGGATQFSDSVFATGSFLDFQSDLSATLVDLGGSTMSIGGVFSAVDTLRLAASDLQLLNATGLDVASLELDGTIAGTGTVLVASTMDWLGGTLGSPDGNLSVSIGELADAFVATPGPRFMAGIVTLSVDGALGWSDGDITMSDNARIDVSSVAAFNIGLTAPGTLGFGGGNPLITIAPEATLNNFGAAPVDINVTTSVSGAAISSGADLLFSRGGSHAGTFEALSGGQISFGSAGDVLHVINGPVLGAGTIRFAETNGATTQVSDGTQYQPFETIIDGGQVDIAGVAEIGRLVLSGGDLGGDGQLTVSDRMDWTGGSVGVFGAGGTLTIASEALLDISGSDDKNIRGDWRLDNLGTIDWNAGDIILRQSSELFNVGTLNANLIEGDQSLRQITASPTITHGALATLNRSGNTSVLTVDAPARMFGSVNVLDGALRFVGGGIQSANYFIETGALVEFSGAQLYSWNEGMGFAGNGVAAVSDGFAVVNAAAIEVENLSFSDGVIAGNGSLLVGNSMLWSGGTLGSPGFTGALEVGLDATLDIDSAAVVALSDWRLSNLGQTNWTNGNISFVGNALIENTGAFNAILASGPQFFLQNTGFSARFENAGQFTVAPGAGEFASNVFINNIGGVQINNSLTRLQSGSASSEGGNWSIDGASVLQLEGGTHATTNSSFSGAGTLQLSPGATLASNGGNLFIDNLLLDGGVLRGTGTTFIEGSLEWRSGTIGAPGDLSDVLLSAGAQGVMTTAGVKSLTDAALLYDTDSFVVWDGGEIRLQDAAQLSIRGNLAIRTDTDITSPDATGFVQTIGTGFITKDGGDGTTRFLTDFVNDGAMAALTGTISLERGATHAGDFFVQPPAEILFVGDHTLLGEFVNLGDQIFTDATMTIDGPFFANNVIIDDFSTITFNGTYEAASTSILNNSVAEFLFAASTGDLTVAQNSDIAGPGTLTVTGMATIDQLALTRAGATVFDATSTLTADDLAVFGFAPLFLNGAATIGNLLVFGGGGDEAVSVGGSLASTNILIDGGTLTGPGDTQVGGSLTLRPGGMIDGDGSISVAGTFDWIDGLLAGSGTLDIAPGGSLVASPGAALTIRDRTIRNRSTEGGIDLVDVGLVLDGSAVLDNQGSMRIETLPGAALGFLTGTGTVLNSGSFVAVGAPSTGSGFAGEIRIDNRFDNSGSVSVNSGSLLLYGGGTHSGSFEMAPLESFFTAGRLRLRGTHALDATSALSGATLAVESGTTSISGSIDLDNLLVSTAAELPPGQVVLDSDAALRVLGLFDGNPLDAALPSLTGAGAITVADEFTWEGGTIGATGAGTLTLADTVQTSRFGLADFRPDDTPLPLLTLSGRTLVTAIADARLARGRLLITDGGVFENEGGFTFGVAGDAPVTIDGGVDGTFRNTGTVDGASGLVLGTNSENAGTLQAQDLGLAAGVNLTQSSGSITTPGTFDIAGNFMLLGGSVAAATTRVTGSLGGVGTITGDLTNSGIFSPGTSPGEFVIDGDFTQDALGTLILEIDGNATDPGIDFDLLAISGTASFDGSLELITLDGFAGTFGSSFQPITYASATGGFARVVQPQGTQFNASFGPTGLLAEIVLGRNPDGTLIIDPDNPPIPENPEQAEEIADAVARSRGTTQEDIEATDTTVVTGREQELVQEECSERLDRPDGETADDGAQGVGCRSI